MQDDAHIFCTESQIGDEVKGVLDFLAYAYGIFGFEFDLELSTRPEKYLGELATWDKAEKLMAGALDSFGRKWQVRPHGYSWQRQRKGSGSRLELLQLWRRCCTLLRTEAGTRYCGARDLGAPLLLPGGGMSFSSLHADRKRAWHVCVHLFTSFF